MRFVVLAALSLFSASSFASTQVLFAKDGSKASILFLAMTPNPDADDLYAMMTAPEQDMNGRHTKKFSLADFSTVCVFSKITSGLGSCAITLQASSHLQANAAQGTIRYSLEGADATSAAANFNLKGSYHSSDGHFSLRVEPASFILEYR